MAERIQEREQEPLMHLSYLRMFLQSTSKKICSEKARGRSRHNKHTSSGPGVVKTATFPLGKDVFKLHSP